MMKDIKELIAKKLKNKEMMKDHKKAAFGKMTETLSDIADEAMKEDLTKRKGMQKVTVMAKDEKGLKEGLEKAEDILEDMPGMKTDEEMEDERQEDMQEETMDEAAEMATEMPLEDIDKEIARLMKLKEQKFPKA